MIEGKADEEGQPQQDDAASEAHKSDVSGEVGARWSRIGSRLVYFGRHQAFGSAASRGTGVQEE